MVGCCHAQVVDAGDMAMWFLHSFVWQLLWFVGGWHCLSWWGLLGSNMVIGCTWCG